jgi:small subunit ribosomal protein S6
VRTYEGMLLVEPTIAAKEWQRVVDEVERIAKRHGAAVLQVSRWGERKLAYPVKKNNRGTYVLTYFSAPPKVVGKIRADLQLSEVVLRHVILQHEGELRKEAPKDFETAGPLPPKTDRPGFGGGGFGGGDRFGGGGFRPGPGGPPPMGL